MVNTAFPDELETSPFPGQLAFQQTMKVRLHIEESMPKDEMYLQERVAKMSHAYKHA